MLTLLYMPLTYLFIVKVKVKN